MQGRRLLIETAAIAPALASGCGGDEPGPDEPGTTGQPFEWESVDLDFQLESVVALGDGFVGQAVEAKPGVQPEDEPSEFPFTTTVVTSPDGITWSQADLPDLRSDEMVQWRDGGPFGAVATVMDPSDQSPVPELLFTADGVEWCVGSCPPMCSGRI